MRDTEDKRLVREALDGKSASFEELIGRYRKEILNLAFRMTRNEEDSKDLAQIIFIKTYNSLDTFNFKSKFFSWLYRIAINEIINHKRSLRAHESIDGMQFSDTSSPESIFEDSEFATQFDGAINSLKPEYKVLVVLKYYEGLSYQDISEVLGLTEAKIKSRLFAARQTLRNILEKNGIV